MRITKVSVWSADDHKDRMVLIKRTPDNGTLVFDNGAGWPGSTDKTDLVLKTKQDDSFKLSILNQTILKKEIAKRRTGKQFDNQFYDALKRFIANVLKNDCQPTDCNILGCTDSKKIDRYLNHRFCNRDIAMECNGQTLWFNLANAIAQSIEQKTDLPMQPYRMWAKRYTETKSDKLKKSVSRNKIVMGDICADNEQTLSPRKRALMKWEDEFLLNKTIDLNEMHHSYGMAGLVNELKLVISRKQENSDMPMFEFDNRSGHLTKQNEYHRQLKKVLQEHQRHIFGCRENPNIENRNNNVQLYAYNVEVTKYIERYFPLKNSNRTTTQSSIEYYLNFDTLTGTINRQIGNAVRNNLIRQGRFEFHKGENNRFEKGIDSNVLTAQKADEAFVLNLIGNCAFAANNIRNIVDPEQTNDILGRKDLRESLERGHLRSAEEKAAKNDLFRFFFGSEVKNEDITDEVFWAMQAAVIGIRHKVVHYKADALEKIFDNDCFLESEEKKSYSDTIFRNLLANELKNAEKAFAGQLKSGGVLTYFATDDVVKLLRENKFSLYRSVAPFAPSFKRIMKGGTGYNTAERDGRFYDLELTVYNDCDNKNEWWQARYFLMKTIYNNLFLPKFTTHTATFKDAVNFVLKKNRAQASNGRNKKAYAFNGIRTMRRGESIASYMGYVQSYLMIEKNKKLEADKTENVNFEKFVLQIFIKGFDTFMRHPSFGFVLSAALENQIVGDSKHEQANRLNSIEQTIVEHVNLEKKDIDTNDNTHIAFYIFCKLLDSSHLSNLRNELTKYRQSQRGRQDEQNERKEMKHLLSIIELCLLSVDTYPIDQMNESELTPFLETGKTASDYENLYMQSNSETVVPHRTIAKSCKYKTYQLLETLVNTNDTYRMYIDNYNDWAEKKKTIETDMATRNRLHREWVRCEQKNKFPEEKAKEYEDACTRINDYDWLHNKLHFVHLKNLHNLTIDILGRMAGFTALFERDFQYICKNNAVNEHQPGMNELEFSEGLPRFKKKDPRKPFLQSIFLYYGYGILRNYIAHFNFLTTAGKSEEQMREITGIKNYTKFSILDMINELRQLFRYDRKLRNAVSKAFIDLFDRNGMILKFKFDNDNGHHALEIESLEPKQIIHLGGLTIGRRKITTPQLSQEYCDMCKSLLTLK